MRILEGRWAGRHLVSPGGRVRPTAESVRGAWMGWLGGRLADARVIELFAGTGALGLEALSRGAASVDFVENGAAALHALKANVAALRARDSTRIFKRDAVPFVEALDRHAYDLALADPPYGSGVADRIVRRWLEVPFAATLAIEHDPAHALPGRPRTRRFGDAAVSLYR